MGDVVLVSRAYAFAAERHTGQFRKGKKKEPYINHPIEVAELVTIATNGRDRTLIAAAVLHDTIEDTPATYAQVKREFGEEVAAIVREVTDNKNLDKDRIKELQIRNMPKKSKQAKMIKIADKISNLRGITYSPPANWSTRKKIAYLEFSRAVVDGARGANAWLERVFDEVALDLEKHIAEVAKNG